jgi:myo-inositol catabolism protein IolC
MSMFHVVLSQSGPEWDRFQPLEGQSGWREHAAFMDELVDRGFVVLGGPVPGHRVVHAVEAASEEEIRSTLASDPWSGSHLVIESIEPWTIRLDGR